MGQLLPAVVLKKLPRLCQGSVGKAAGAGERPRHKATVVGRHAGHMFAMCV